MRCSRTQALRRTYALPSLPPSSPQVALGPSPATQYRKAQALLRSPRRLLGRPDAEASSSSPPPALPPSGSANMAQTDELVLAFAFASASKWGSEIDAEEEGGSLRGCLPDSSLIYVHARWHERVSFSSARVRRPSGGRGIRENQREGRSRTSPIPLARSG